MRILVLSPVFPYPASDGDRIRIFNIIEQLKKQGKHKLHLVTFCRAGEEALKPELKEYFETVETLAVDKKHIMAGAFKGVFSKVPLNVTGYESPAMKLLVKKAVEAYSPDVIFTYRLRMAQYAFEYAVPKVIDYVDSLALFMKRSAVFEGSLLKRLYYLFDGPRVEKYERETAAKFAGVFINSEEDAQYLGGKNIITAPNGAMTTPKGRGAKKSPVYTVGFMGNMPYGPNREAVRYFFKNVWKKTFGNDKNIKFVIAGRGADIFKDIAGGNVELKSNVADVGKEISSWHMSVAPVRYGAGRQNKVMDYWACGIPVVAAPFAAKGVYGINGKNLLIAENAGQYAEMIKLLRDKPGYGKKLAAAAKTTLKRYFEWNNTGKIINKAVETAAISWKKRTK